MEQIPIAIVGCGGMGRRHLAVLSIDGPSSLAAGTTVAAEVMARWVAAWRMQGRPGFAQVRPRAELYPGGWRIRLLPPAGGDVRTTRRG